MNLSPLNDQVVKFIRKKQLLSLSFSLLMAIPFFTFVFVMAFKPAWLTAPVHGRINTGLWLAFGIILWMFVLIWTFVKWKTTHDDTGLNQATSKPKKA